MKLMVIIKRVMGSVAFKTLLLMAVLSTLLSQRGLAQTNDSIPFLYRGHLFVPSIINDSVSCIVIFDTGAANMYGVDSVFLEHCGWHPEHFGDAYTGGAAGKTKVRIITEKTKVNIGNIEDRYGIVPIFKLRDVLDCHVDGIWGIKNVADYPFEINFEHSYLKQHKAGMPCLDGYQKLPILYEQNRIMLQAETYIGGTVIKGWYLMDTGSGSTIDFTAKTVKDYRLDWPTRRFLNGLSAQPSIEPPAQQAPPVHDCPRARPMVAAAVPIHRAFLRKSRLFVSIVWLLVFDFCRTWRDVCATSLPIPPPACQTRFRGA